MLCVSEMANPSSSSDDKSQYASYDLICCIEDRKSKSNAIRTVTFFTTCIVVSLIGGFGLHMAINSRKYRQGMEEGLKAASQQQQQAFQHGATTRYGGVGHQTVELEDPMIFASRALGWGTLYAVLGSGSIGLTAVCIWKL